MIRPTASALSGLTLVAAISLVIQLMLISPASASALTTAECRDRTVIDFGQVLDAMRPRAHPPSSGRLPFGPPGLHLGYIGSTLLPGGGEIGFSLRNQPETEGGWQSEWMAQSTLSLIRKSGAPIELMREKRQDLDPVINGRVESQHLGEFRVSGKAAFYRFELLITHGSVIKHRYREYYRVVNPRVDLRLALSDSTPRPGDRLFWRLENYGTFGFDYGLAYNIERYESGRWLTDPISPTGFVGVGFFSIAGAASKCQSMMLPAEMAPGRYRVSKPASSGSDKERLISSEFWVGT